MSERLDTTEIFLALERVLAQKIRARQKDLAHWRQQREEAAKKEDECLRDISEMEMATAVFRRALGLPANVLPTGELDVLRFRSQTVAQSCYDMIHEAGGRARVIYMTKKLVQAGKLKDARTGYATVTKALDRDARFIKVGRGEYAVVDSASEIP